MLIAERFGLPPVEHSLVLSVCHVHERCHTLVRRHGYGREEIAGAPLHVYSSCFCVANHIKRDIGRIIAIILVCIVA